MILNTDFSPADANYMARAIRLAQEGEYSVTPNPSVGCLLVCEQSQIVGEGYHVKAGTPHAEVHALRQAGDKARGATAYVTLEPCSHYGRTGPCAKALIEAGVAKVVIASRDSNPEVAGKGIAMLQDAGIYVTCGLMQDAAQALNLGFFTRMRTGKPFVIVKLAASLDGKTALHNGQSQWITSEYARRDVQIERAKSCAILSGSGTVLSDDPRLNVRLDELPKTIADKFIKRGSQALRVIVDGKNQMHPNLKVLNDAHPTLIYNSQENNQLNKSSVEQVQLNESKNDRHIDLSRMLDDLGSRQINRLWVEAGAKLAGALLDAGLVDELVVYTAPKLLGSYAMELVSTKTKNHLHEALEARVLSVKQVGPDIKVNYSLR